MHGHGIASGVIRTIPHGVASACVAGAAYVAYVLASAVRSRGAAAEA